MYTHIIIKHARKKSHTYACRIIAEEKYIYYGHNFNKRQQKY